MAREGSREPLEIEERGSVLLYFLWEVLSSRFTVPHLLSNELFTPLFFTLAPVSYSKDSATFIYQVSCGAAVATTSTPKR
jgi:hypothetical protein